jgi:hypothetical protein
VLLWHYLVLSPVSQNIAFILSDIILKYPAEKTEEEISGSSLTGNRALRSLTQERDKPRAGSLVLPSGELFFKHKQLAWVHYKNGIKVAHSGRSLMSVCSFLYSISNVESFFQFSFPGISVSLELSCIC